MKCPKCGYESLPDRASFCPNCGEKIAKAAKPSTRIDIDQKVGKVEGGKVAGVVIGKVKGKLTIRSTANQIEKKIVKGDYVDRQTITNNIMVLGPQALDEIVNRIAAMQGIDKQTLHNLGTLTVPENVSRQIAEVEAAQKDVAAKGLPVSAQASYQLGMLAAYDRKYEEALDYFRQATQSCADYSDAYEAIAWIQQARAHDDLGLKKDFNSAVARLEEARRAAMHTDPLDVDALSLRGYIVGTLAQVAKATDDESQSRKYQAEAANLFTHAVQLNPANPSALKGLATSKHEMGDLDAAISMYLKTIKLAANYTSAHHDLAIAYEDKMQVDPKRKTQWCRKALKEWQKAYELAPKDPGFSENYIVQQIGQRIIYLKQQCEKVI